ncbi:MAG: endolytic transglycosylase MltG [Mycobacteriales bacterium]
MTDRDLDRAHDSDLDSGLLGEGGLAGASRTGGAHRHRHRDGRQRGSGRKADTRRRGRPGRGRRGRTLAALLVVVVMLGGLGGGIWYGGSKLLSAFGHTPDYSGAGAGSVTVQIMTGDTATDVANALAKAGVVKSPKAFVEAAKNDPRSTNLQPGTYRLHKQMKAVLALNLLFDPAARLLARVTLPEGFSVGQTLARIAANTKLPIAQLQAAAKDTAKLGLPGYAKGRLEGFLYPATYDIEPGTTPIQVLQMMVAKFNEVAAATGFEAKAVALKLTPYDAITVASLVQEEGQVVTDMPKIARVIYNRLAKDVPLGIDAAIFYGLGRTGGELTAADLAKPTPYNNRLLKGLPPTPIDSPGIDAVAAAVAPATGDWLYYVLMDKQGHQFFTNSYQAFVDQKAKSKREGVFK